MDDSLEVVSASHARALDYGMLGMRYVRCGYVATTDLPVINPNFITTHNTR